LKTSTYYIDCGIHLGEGSSILLSKLNLNPDMFIVAFEPNRITFNELLKLKSSNNLSDKYTFLKHKNLVIHNKAVWTKNGSKEMSFSRQELPSSIKNNEYVKDFMVMHNNKVKSGDLIAPHQDTGKSIDGSSTFFSKRNKRFLQRKGNILQKNIDFSLKEQVTTIDFSSFILTEIPKNSEIILKMDIEGAEFRVLNSLIRSGAIKRISKLYVEWHSYSYLTLKLAKMYIKLRLKFFTVQVNEWH
jgi:FkbM family methyltransferase